MNFVIPVDHPALPGHFPGQPIVPGVVILEHVQRMIESATGLAGAWRIAQVKFLQPLLPGETATIALARKGEAWAFQVLRGEVRLVTGEMQPA